MRVAALKNMSNRLQNWARVRLPHDFWQRWPPHIVSGILLILIAAVLWQYVGVWRETATVNLTKTAGASLHRSVPPDPLSKILSAHLFGVANSTIPPPTVSPSSTWSLIGLVNSTDPTLSIADVVINGQEHLIHIGDRLPDGSRVRAITESSVTLDMNGSESLITYALRPAPIDVHFTTLPTKNFGSVLIVQAPKATMRSRTTSTITLTALRRNALAIWKKRFHHAKQSSSKVQ